MRKCFILALLAGFLAAPTHAQTNLWQLARDSAAVHRFSTLFTAQDVRDSLSSDAASDEAIRWCQASGVTKVYLEEFRDGYQADRAMLVRARDHFLAQGFLVSGCVTTTRVGKPSDHWSSEISCYTDPATQDHLQSVFEYAAGLFDEIMIDDFWFTDCTCSNCEAARRSQAVTLDSRTYPVSGDTWSDYRGELMLRLSEDRLLAAAKNVNPKARLIIKYPQWYDMFQERGYDVTRETAVFDRIWVGTETRDYTNAQWGHTPQYEGYFLMRWLGGIGGEKCGGGGTTGLAQRSTLTWNKPGRQCWPARANPCCSISAGFIMRRGRLTSKRCETTFPNCSQSPAKSNAASRRALPPTNRPTAVRRMNRASSIMPG